MPNLVNTIMLEELKSDFGDMGSCLVVSFDKLDVGLAQDVRDKFRDEGLRFQVVKNRLAVRAFSDLDMDLASAFDGKCGIVIAPEEKAISAAKLIRESTQQMKTPPMVVTGGVIEGEVIVGPGAATIADLPDKDAVRSQLCGAINGLARGLAVALQAAGGAGLARAVQARVDKESA